MIRQGSLDIVQGKSGTRRKGKKKIQIVQGKSIRTGGRKHGGKKGGGRKGGKKGGSKGGVYGAPGGNLGTPGSGDPNKGVVYSRSKASGRSEKAQAKSDQLVRKLATRKGTAKQRKKMYKQALVRKVR